MHLLCLASCGRLQVYPRTIDGIDHMHLTRLRIHEKCYSSVETQFLSSIRPQAHQATGTPRQTQLTAISGMAGVVTTFLCLMPFSGFGINIMPGWQCCFQPEGLTEKELLKTVGFVVLNTVSQFGPAMCRILFSFVSSAILWKGMTKPLNDNDINKRWDYDIQWGLIYKICWHKNPNKKTFRTCLRSLY